MARPQRNNVDYFPHLCKEGKSMFYIEKKYGNDGYATWMKTLRQLAVTNYHYLNLKDETEVMFLASKCNIEEEKLKSILTDLAKLGEINRELWEDDSIVYSEKFIETIEDAYAKRNNNPLDLEGLLQHLHSLGIRKLELTPSKGDENTQSKEEYSKEEKNKEEYPFDGFWNLYDKKRGDKTKIEKKWDKLTEEVKKEIMEYIPKYKQAQPDKQYRKDPTTFLNNRGWKDELIFKEGQTQGSSLKDW